MFVLAGFELETRQQGGCGCVIRVKSQGRIEVGPSQVELALAPIFLGLLEGPVRFVRGQGALGLNRGEVHGGAVPGANTGAGTSGQETGGKKCHKAERNGFAAV